MALLPLPLTSDRFLDFRPRDYSCSTLLPDRIRTRVKGQARREMAGDLIERHDYDLPRELVTESLDDANRRALGRMHPSLMSGEYLPNLRPGEVEVARVILRSVTGDVMSVRARQEGKRIAFRVVDEYWDESADSMYSPITSVQPLTLGELLDYMETCCEGGILLGYADANLEGGSSAEELEGFVRAESAFYPDLAAVVDERMTAWVEGHRIEDEEDDE